MFIGYARVSTNDQETATQVALKAVTRCYTQPPFSKPRQRNLWVTDTFEQCREGSARGAGEPAAGCWPSACFLSQLPFRTSLTSSVNATPSGRTDPTVLRKCQQWAFIRPGGQFPVSPLQGRVSECSPLLMFATLKE